MIRNMRRLGLILLTLPFLMANQSCDSIFASLGLGSYLDDACGSSALTPYIGAALGAVPSSLTTGDLVRIINPGDAVTMDYSASRLNISLNDAGEIIEVSCG